MYRVETHNNSKKYYQNLNIEKDALYITANTSLSNMIIEISKVNQVDKWRILDIENFVKNIYPKWTNTINQIKLKSKLRKIIIEVKSSLVDEKSIKEIKFLEENISLVFSDFMFLVQAGINYLNYNSDDKKLNLIKDIFNKYVQCDLFKEVSMEVLNVQYTRNFTNNIIKNYLEHIDKKDMVKARELRKSLMKNKNEVKKIYFYNINYLDLKRYLLIEFLKTAGYEIIFRIPYFENLNVVNKSWNMIYRNSDLFSLNINKEYSISEKKNLKYISFLEGENFSSYDKENVTVKNYKEVYDFKRDIKDKKIITFYKDSLKSCAMRNKAKLKNHCYQSAIGSFLFNLYKSIVNENEIKMDFNIYREMITSGWLEYKGWNGIRVSAYLTDNAEYFSGVKTLDDIIIRIEKLKDIEEVSDIFESQVKGRIKKDKRKAFLSNPFRAFGYANTETYNITANYMLEVTLKLKRFLNKTFYDESGLIDVKEHLKDLKYLFRNEYLLQTYKYGSEIQKRVCKKIYELLNNPQFFGEYIYRNELEELLNLYLKLKDEETEEGDFSIDQLEGLILRDKFISNNNDKIYLTDLSYSAYKKYISKYNLSEKVITKEDLAYIFNESLAGINKEIVFRGLTLQEKSKQASESYIKFTLANLFINFDGDIEFSWIEGLRNDDSKSILLKQIEAIYKNTKIVDEGLEDNNKADENFIKFRELEELHYNYNDKKEIKGKGIGLPEAAYVDLDFCPQKFLYSSILEEYPKYFSDFHQRLVFSSLVGMIKNNIEDDYKNLYMYILPLFPQWKDVEKKNVLDCEYAKKGLRNYKYFDGINYPKNVDSLYLLKSRYIVERNNKIKNEYKKGEFNGDNYFNKFVDEYLNEDVYNNGFHCKMCPHCYICKKGDFVIDSK